MSSAFDDKIPHVKCVLNQYRLGDGSFSYGINIKDQFGNTFHIAIKEANKNLFGKVNDIYGISLRDIFKNDDIRKYDWVGNQEILLEASQNFSNVERKQND